MFVVTTSDTFDAVKVTSNFEEALAFLLENVEGIDDSFEGKNADKCEEGTYAEVITTWNGIASVAFIGDNAREQVKLVIDRANEILDKEIED